MLNAQKKGAEPQAAAGGERDFHRRWRLIEPPLRPHPDAVERVRSLLPEAQEPVLQLGVTPEIAKIPDRLIAVDWNPVMVETAWPGNTAEKTALVGDWRTLPVGAQSVSAVIGDCSLNCLRYPDDLRLVLEELGVVMVRGGRAVIRCFTQPEPPTDLAEVRRIAMSGVLPFHAFKLRFNLAAAFESGDPTIVCGTLFERFEALFPDRDELSQASGWSLDTIAEMDTYRASPAILTYPSRQQFLDLMPDWVRQARFVESGDYPVADCCPILVLDAA